VVENDDICSGGNVVTYDKQDLLLDLRKLAVDANSDPESAHADADAALIRFIDDEHIREAFNAIAKWYS